MYIIKCKGLTEVWANKPGGNFLHSVSKYFSVKLEQEITDDDLEVYEVDAPSENARLAILAHHRHHHHEGYKLRGSAKKMDLVDLIPAKPPELQVGDDDPDDPGTPVPASDPRTRATPASASVKQTVALKKVKSWARKEPNVYEL